MDTSMDTSVLFSHRDIATFPDENPFPVMRVNREGTLLYANPASDDILRRWGSSVGGTIPDEWRSRVRDGYRDTNRRYPLKVGKRDYVLTVTAVPGKTYFNLYGIDVSEIHRWAAERVSHRAEPDRLQQRMEHLVFAQLDTIRQTQASLELQTSRREYVEEQFNQRTAALEEVYAMATAFASSLESHFEQVALSIASLLHASPVCLHQLAPGRQDRIVQVQEGRLRTLPESGTGRCPVCVQVAETRAVTCLDTPGEESCPVDSGNRCMKAHPVLGVPIVNTAGTVLGVIVSINSRDQAWSDYEVHLVEIFARYLGHEINRAQLEAELRQTQELQLLGTLTSGVAHEVRNPLHAIMTIMEAVNKELGDDPAFVPYLYHLRSQVERLSRLMEDLLHLGRPLKEEQMELVSLEPLIIEAVHDCGGFAREKKCTVHFHHSPETASCVIRGDRGKIQQVIVNCLENALQHSEEQGQVTVTCRVSGSHQVCFSVSDTGCGLSGEVSERAFEPFFTTRRDGTGLGLSIVKHISQMHGGTVRLVNNAGPGATLTVHFPRATVPAG